jgi:DNA-binding IclR family transcriptional regulator
MPTKEIKSIRNCFRILSLFSKQNPFLDADGISRAVGIPKSSAYRYLNTLTQESILEYNHTTKKYQLGIKILELGGTAYHRLELRKIAIPFMKELAEMTRETVYLTALDKDRTVCIERIESDLPVRLSIERGETFPLHAGATARILMAYLSSDKQDKIIEKGLEKFTDYTITDPFKLRRSLIKVKKQGYAFSEQERDIGAKAVSAPIFDFFGEVIAGLSIAGPINRFIGRKAEEYKNLVVDYSHRISSKLGYNSYS